MRENLQKNWPKKLLAGSGLRCQAFANPRPDGGWLRTDGRMRSYPPTRWLNFGVTRPSAFIDTKIKTPLVFQYS